MNVAAPRLALALVVLVFVLAVAGTLLAGAGWRDWYDALDKPGWLVPLEAFYLVAALYYALAVVILYRIATHATGRARLVLLALGLVVLVANEAWNYAFLGRESVTAGFLGMLAFAVLVGAWLVLLWRERQRVAAALLAPYALWVLYDVAWTFELWRRNT